MTSWTLKSGTIVFILATVGTWSVRAEAIWGPVACMRALGGVIFPLRPVPGIHGERELKVLEQGTPRQREYVAQLRRIGAAWTELKAPLNAELDRFEGMSRADRARHLAEVSAGVTEGLRRKYGAKNIGVHYNMHGGGGLSYVDGGGIRAGTPNLPALNHRDHVDINRERVSEVYFFQTDAVALHDILGTTHQDHPLFPFLRMGDTVVLFNLDPLLSEGVKSGLVIRSNTQFIRFDPTRVPEDAVGVPDSLFLVPPMPLFFQIPARLGRYNLSWDGETLAALRVMERVLLAPEGSGTSGSSPRSAPGTP